MNTKKSKEFMSFVEKEMQSQINKFTQDKLAKEMVTELSKEVTSIIDWDNSALMHKGLSWIAKKFLIKKELINN